MLNEFSNQNPIYDKLNSNSITKREIIKRNEELKKAKELENCTFKPKIRPLSNRYSLRSRSSVYERLSQSNKKQKEELYKKERQANEIKGCTFHPQVKTERHNMSTDTIESAFDRLHNKAMTISQVKKLREVENKEASLSIKKIQI